MSASVLERILADKRARLDRGEFVALEKPAGVPEAARFVEALRGPGVRILAEIKQRSPSAGEILHGADGKVESLALAYRRGHAAAISIVTEEDHFGGRPDWLPRAKRISGLPALMKDFFVSERQLDLARSLGADAILLIVRALSDRELTVLARAARERELAVVVEAHDAEEIARAASLSPDVLGVNARDLTSFRTDLEELEALAEAIPEGPVRLAESAIRSRADLERLRTARYQAFLIGEALLRSDDPEQLLRELGR